MPSPVSLRQITLRAAAVVAAAGLVTFAAACGGGSGGSGGGSGGNDIAAATTGQDVFSAAGCASCHTLADAGAEGRIGPNLDEDKPSAERVVTVVRDGDGRMPAFGDRLSAEQIQALGDYIAEVAGQ